LASGVLIVDLDPQAMPHRSPASIAEPQLLDL